MRVLVFGQVGLRKKRFLERLQKLAATRNRFINVYHMGTVMGEIDDTVPRGRILNRDVVDIAGARRAAVSQIAAELDNRDSRLRMRAETVPEVHVVNTHAVFRWSHGLFPGFKPVEIRQLAPSICVTLIDNVQNVARSLELREARPNPLTLYDIMAWREEEILAGDLAAASVSDCRNYVVPIDGGEETVFRLLFNPKGTRVYLSYPISRVKTVPSAWRQVELYRTKVKDHFTCFDPYSICEGMLVDDLRQAGSGRPDDYVALGVPREPEGVLKRTRAEVESIVPYVNAQIVGRDYRLIDQSDLLVAYFPVRNGTPELSEGVEQELAHARGLGRDTHAIWPSKKPFSPFLLSQGRTTVHKSVSDFLEAALPRP
ncbi:MAG: hypothetical protein GX600_05885 [Dehalococcoidia bacterium]|nr:hypothetical protein [Dehalococcoidia bacterium]